MDKKPCSILVVDDSEDYRNLLSLYLEELSCETIHAHDGEDAVELCETRRFDVIIMDIIMPLMDGVEAIRAIRKLEVSKGRDRTPILALSAEGSVETGVDSMDAGASRMLVKPVSREGLVGTIRELLRDGA